ncbi:hypothetical protein PGT21_000230 [Puccinia graminis f. sp. tritici]|uniref:Kinetochore protein SPC25 n=1 Tax=Puccinia graminis f. sp. tritici TaxID=56615 RepID=A0A5B0S4M4_PUCGR|nr:hypothetical protein PGT21_000230 [Puccinia graminis f. sp. tritici]KAA1090351.1 hypothetical protein PGTUg99_006475 [Puccinia graminis f. sp. tritici]KAA1132315.1 hypothetical protein PGTUg99_005487 [Puccinia graminis f. sp. tritici]
MTPEEHQATASTPATSKRINLSASYIPNQNPIGSLISKVNPYLGPKKERKILVGTPPLTRTPSQAPLPTVPATPQTYILLQSPEPPQIPEGRVGYNPELRSILSKHEESLQRLIDRYSRHKLHLSHQLDVDLAELEHQQTKSKCKLALIQKELTETVESNEKLNNKLSATRNQLSKLRDDQCEKELGLDKLNRLFSHCKLKFVALEEKKNTEKGKLVRVIEETKNKVHFLEEITVLTILILIDMNTYDRVFYIELDLAESDYRIVLMDPPCNEMGLLLEKLNQTRDFNRFLCDARQTFKKSTMNT